MAYTTINKSSLNFNTVLFTGNSTSRNITGVGFQPDFTWIKSRSQARDNVNLNSVVSGWTSSNNTYANNTDSNYAYTPISDGFTIGTANDVNGNGYSQCAWNWKAGTAVSGNSGGSGSPKVYTGSVNATAGFSIIKYIGNGTSGQQIPHHLGAIAGMVIRKKLDSTDAWNVWHTKIGNSSKALYLNTTNAIDTNTNYGTSVPSSSVFYNGSDSMINANETNYIAYCFADVQGYSKFGGYTGNGNADGTFVYTGFKPAFVMFKRTDSTANWTIVDTKRDIYNPTNKRVFPDLTNTENTSLDPFADLTSNGFKLKASSTAYNGSGGTYIYMAFAEAPLVGTNNVPCTAR